MSKVVKLRIAAAVDSEGEWAATGWSSDLRSYDDDAMGVVSDSLGDDPKYYWLEIELPIPEVVVETVQPVVISVN